MLNWWWHRRRKLAERRAQAEAELAESAKLLAETRQVIAPIQKAASRNQFAEMIRTSLQEGHRT